MLPDTRAADRVPGIESGGQIQTWALPVLFAAFCNLAYLAHSQIPDKEEALAVSVPYATEAAAYSTAAFVAHSLAAFVAASAPDAASPIQALPCSADDIEQIYNYDSRLFDYYYAHIDPANIDPDHSLLYMAREVALQPVFQQMPSD